MPRKAKLFLVTVAALLPCSLSSAGIVFEKPNATLGTVKAVGSVEHRFAFTVDGSGPAEIMDVRPSCGCVRTSLAKSRFQPGESGVIPLVIHVSSQAEGKKRFELTLLVRDPVERTIVLTAETDIQSDVKVEPSNLVVQLHDGQSSKHRIVIRDRRPRPLKIEDVVVSHPAMKAKLLPVGRDRHERIVELTISSGMQTGRFAERVEIRAKTTENPAFPEAVTLEIPVNILRPTTYTLLPEKLKIRRSDLADGRLSRNVTVIDRSGTSPEIRLVSAEAAIETSSRRESPGVVKMKVVLNADAKSTQAELRVNGKPAGVLPIEIQD